MKRPDPIDNHFKVMLILGVFILGTGISTLEIWTIFLIGSYFSLIAYALICHIWKNSKSEFRPANPTNRGWQAVAALVAFGLFGAINGYWELVKGANNTTELQNNFVKLGSYGQISFLFGMYMIFYLLLFLINNPLAWQKVRNNNGK
ncbi:MAG: hypothetical protein IPJ89_03460 [Candidatus Iainarchaeum archaeon]|uniref:Uncharacterized protein n=1 Tax=Candidatus Iainarchaeum sp. TaxID=3101447 RepID=A0A7T9DIX7_9ARCH|nr:MAG: hypothetical protein IPJ89_03460 [Candidatus Diapherotrites archaeon]